MTRVVDTNVILVANRQHAGVGEACVVACTKYLQSLMADGRVAIDDAYRILREYQGKTSPHVGNRAGDAFVKWLLRNNANIKRCDQVSLVEHAERGFESFPGDERLTRFDSSDRKFVAVARAHPNRPAIAQAADSKWLSWSSALRDNGVAVEFLCTEDIARFDQAKRAGKRRKR